MICYLEIKDKRDSLFEMSVYIKTLYILIILNDDVMSNADDNSC